MTPWPAALLLGIGLALVPKPMFVPVLIWLAVQRRNSFVGVVLSALLVTAPQHSSPRRTRRSRDPRSRPRPSLRGQPRRHYPVPRVVTRGVAGRRDRRGCVRATRPGRPDGGSHRGHVHGDIRRDLRPSTPGRGARRLRSRSTATCPGPGLDRRGLLPSLAWPLSVSSVPSRPSSALPSPSVPSSSTGCPTARSMPGAATSSTSRMPSSTDGSGSSPPWGPTTSSTGTATSSCPFAPFPALVLAPLVALIGPVTADQVGVRDQRRAGGRGGPGRLVDGRADRRGSDPGAGGARAPAGLLHAGLVGHHPGRRVAHGHLVAMILTLLLIAELFGKARPVLLGLLVGAAFLTRAPVAFATPAVALWFLVASPSAGAWPFDRRAPGPAAVARVGAPGRGPGAVPGVLLLVQPRALRLPAGVRVRAGDAARVAGEPAEAGAVRPGPRADERGLPVPQAAGVHGRVPVLPPGRPGHVGAVHEPGAAAGGAGAVAGRAVLDPAAGRRAGPHPDAALLRRWLAPVRVSLLPGTRSRSSGRWWRWGSSAGARRRGGAGRSSCGAC